MKHSKVKTLEQAIAVITDIVATRKKWGRLADTKQVHDTLVDAVVFLDENQLIATISSEEVTTLRRQLAAANARVAKLAKSKAEDER